MLATNTYACPLEVFFDHQNYVKHHKTWSANNYLFKPSSGMTQIVAPKSMNLVESTILFILLNMSLKHTFGGRYHLPKSHTIRLALFHLSYQCNCQVNYPLFTHIVSCFQSHVFHWIFWLFHALRAMFEGGKTRKTTPNPNIPSCQGTQWVPWGLVPSYVSTPRRGAGRSWRVFKMLPTWKLGSCKQNHLRFKI